MGSTLERFHFIPWEAYISHPNMAKLFVTLSATCLLLLLFTITFRSHASESWGINSLSASPVSVDYNFSHDPHLQARLAHAEKLWEQSVKDRQQMISAFGSRTRFPDGYIYPYNVWDFARPSFFCPHDLERVGTLGDGGKVVCGMSRYERESPGPSSESNPASSLIVYSFGVSTDSSFEAALLKRTNCEIWGYDYTVASFAEDIPGHQLPRTHFSQIGISEVTDEKRDPKFFTVQDLMRRNGHEYIDIVKMDIEGAEFGALTSVIGSLPKDANGKHKPLPFGQLLIELHFDEGGSNQGGPRDLKTWMAWWSALEEHGLRPVNNEDNWIGDVGSGKPRFMEVCPFLRITTKSTY